MEAPCPSCAAPVEFKSRTSLVSICPFCQSVVARGDKKLEDHGKVADLAETQSSLSLDVKGKFRGKPFRIVGRVQYQHSAGGVWDEWYAQFLNGKWGWLAEAQGQFYMKFQKQVKGESRLPNLDSLEAGAKVQLGENEFTVAEVGEGTITGAEGEIPFDFQPGETHPFAVLYGPEGQYATLDYGSHPAGYIGWQVSLDEIGLAGFVRPRKTPNASQPGMSVVRSVPGHSNCSPPTKQSVSPVPIAVRCLNVTTEICSTWKLLRIK